MSRGLPLHERWRIAYASDRYLADQPDKTVFERFRYLFENICTLTPEGKIGVEGFDKEGASLWEAFTHTHQEISIRNLQVPDGFLREARIAPPTFPQPASGDTPSHGQLFKFGKARYLKETLERGVIRLSPASAYSNVELGYAISDNEIQKKLFPPASRVVIRNDAGEDLTGSRLADLTFTFDQGSDYLMWCASSRFAHRMFSDFSADACLVISDSASFFRNVEAALAKEIPDWSIRSSAVAYLDPFRNFMPPAIAALWKDHRYMYQRELRTVAIPSTPAKKLEPLSISIGLDSIQIDLVHR